MQLAISQLQYRPLLVNLLIFFVSFSYVCIKLHFYSNSYNLQIKPYLPI
eukprot:UN11847